MEKKERKIFSVRVLLGLGLCLATLSLGAGCSKGLVQGKLGPEVRWTCDKKADEAIQRKDYELAIELHHQFLEMQPTNGLAMYHLGYAYGHLGNRQKEVSYYEDAVARGFKGDHIFFNLGMAYGELNQPERSIRAFEKSLEVAPGDLEARLNLSMLYAEAGELEKAREQLHKILQEEPNHWEARQLLDSLNEQYFELR